LLLQTVTIVQCGWRHTIAMTDRGNVYSWGRGTSGQLGHGDAVDRATPKRVEILSADGYACEQIESSGSTNCTTNSFPARSGGSPASNWIAPAERYAVVPDETLGPLATRLHQTANVEGHELEVPATSNDSSGDANVPDTDTKRMRTTL
jgi:hypothetical protein